MISSRCSRNSNLRRCKLFHSKCMWHTALMSPKLDPHPGTKAVIYRNSTNNTKHIHKTFHRHEQKLWQTRVKLFDWYSNLGFASTHRNGPMDKATQNQVHSFKVDKGNDGVCDAATTFVTSYSSSFEKMGLVHKISIVASSKVTQWW